MVEDYSYRGNQNRRHVKRDYFNKSYSNPYFDRQTETKAKFNTKLYVKVLLAIFLFYIIIYSDLFRIKEIDVQGTDMIDSGELASLVDGKARGVRWLIFPKRNLIFFNSKDLEKEISGKYLLDSLDIDKGWQKITVKIEEKAAYLIYDNLQAKYFLDSTGAITRQLTIEDINKYKEKFPTVYVMQDVKVGDKPVSARFVNYILELDKALKAAGIKIKNYEGGGVDQVNLVSPDGWRAYFSLNMPMSQAIENLSAVLSQKLRGKRFDYIDLRSGDKVYYK